MTVATDTRALSLGANLSLPVDAVTRTAAVIGQKGTGKTSTAVVMVEEAAVAGARFAVMDPTGAWSGLRSSADGDAPGLDCVVMGGFNGDVPLDPGAGEVVARLVVEEGYSVVCDLERMTRSDQVAFVADFSTHAYELCRSAVTIVYDEAPRFVPQGGAGVEEEGTRCRIAVTEVVMLGRRKGLGSILISQRPSKLHKDVLEQADLLVAHRLMGNNDRKAIAGWLEEYGEESGDWLERLPKLRRGEAVVLAPEYELGGVFQIRMKRTFDSSATPDVGAVLLDAPRGRASIDLSALEQKMGHALEQAQENDPDALRRRIKTLEAQLADGGGADLQELEGARLEIVAVKAEVARLRASMANRGAELRSLAAQSETIASYLELDSFTSDDGARASAPTDTEGSRVPRPRSHPAAGDAERGAGPNGGRVRPVAPAPAGGNAAGPGGAGEQPGSSSEGPPIKAGARRMLYVLARYGPLPRRELAILSKVSPVSGTVSDYLSVLRQRALVTEADGQVRLSDAGSDLVYPDDAIIPPPFTPEEVYALWVGDLKAGARRFVEHLMRAYPEGYTRRELAGLAGISPQSGTVSDYLSVLRRRGLVEERNRRVYAGDVLYLGQQRRWLEPEGERP